MHSKVILRGVTRDRPSILEATYHPFEGLVTSAILKSNPIRRTLDLDGDSYWCPEPFSALKSLKKVVFVS